MHRRVIIGLAIALVTTTAGLAACSNSGESKTSSTAEQTTTTTPGAPWTEQVPQDVVPLDVRSAWQSSNNGQTCPLLWPTVSTVAGLTPVIADEVGGWAYTFDVPGAPGTHQQGYYCPDCGGAAIGIAGTALPPRNPSETATTISYPDGSFVAYTLEMPVGREVTETTPPIVNGEIYIPGASCRYEVYSYLGPDSFVELVNGLHTVQGAP